VAGNFAVWGALFSTFDCSFIAMRGKEDPWNAIASGFFTSGLLSARFGARTAFNAALGGVRSSCPGHACGMPLVLTEVMWGTVSLQAFILALIEGLTIAINRYQGDLAKPQLPEMPDDLLGAPPAAPTPRRAAY
jgi:import inner membrane translocase subunit TIM17